MNKAIIKIGYRSGLVAFLATLAFDIAQTLQLLGILHYPIDEILIYGFSLCIVIPFLIEMLALHYSIAADEKFWSHGALLATVIYAVFVTSNYAVQLTTVIPMTLNGNGEEIKILTQTPHSLFWDYDAIGYIFMGFATLFAAPIFKGDGLSRLVRFTFLVNGFVTTPLIAFVYFYPHFSERLLLIGIPWIITAPASMLLLALWFRARMVSKTIDSIESKQEDVA